MQVAGEKQSADSASTLPRSTPTLPDGNDTPEAPPAPQLAGRVLILGLGNDILTDDAIGLSVVRELAKAFAGDERVDVRETMEMGLALLDFIVGYRVLVLVDSIQTGKAAPGHIHEIEDASLKLRPGPTPHFLGVGETMALGKYLGLTMPKQVRIFAIEVEDPFTLGTQMTPALQRALPTVMERVRAVALELAEPRP